MILILRMNIRKKLRKITKKFLEIIRTFQILYLKKTFTLKSVFDRFNNYSSY